MNRSHYMNGAVAGAVATLFHTAVMFALHQRLSRAARAPLPPVEITSEVAKRAGLDKLQHGPRFDRRDDRYALWLRRCGRHAVRANRRASAPETHRGWYCVWNHRLGLKLQLPRLDTGTSHSAASDAPACPAKRHDGSGSRCVGRRTCGYVRAITATMTARRTRPHVLKSAKLGRPKSFPFVTL